MMEAVILPAGLRLLECMDSLVINRKRHVEGKEVTLIVPGITEH